MLRWLSGKMFTSLLQVNVLASNTNYLDGSSSLVGQVNMVFFPWSQANILIIFNSLRETLRELKIIILKKNKK